MSYYFGVRKPLSQTHSYFIEAAKKSFGINFNTVEEGLALIKEAFIAFESRKERNDESRVNLLFYNGKAYLNGIRPTSSFQNFYLRGKFFQPLQLCDILGYTRDELEAFKVIKDSIDFVCESIENDYYSVRNFWYDARHIMDENEMDYILSESIKNNPPFLKSYLTATSDYIQAAHAIGYNINKYHFTPLMINKVYEYAQNRNKDFFSRLAEYISVFSPVDAKIFEEEYLMDPDMDLAPNIFNELKIYSHTEYIVQYLIKKEKRNNVNNKIYMVTYNDMCENCEELFATNTPIKQGEINTVVVSGLPFINSRDDDKFESYYETNNSMLLIQLYDEDVDFIDINQYKYIKYTPKVIKKEEKKVNNSNKINQTFNDKRLSNNNYNNNNYNNKSNYNNNNFNNNNYNNNTKYTNTQDICPKCGSNLIIKNGKFGEFMGCTNFPNCRFTKNI